MKQFFRWLLLVSALCALGFAVGKVLGKAGASALVTLRRLPEDSQKK